MIQDPLLRTQIAALYKEGWTVEVIRSLVKDYIRNTKVTRTKVTSNESE